MHKSNESGQVVRTVSRRGFVALCGGAAAALLPAVAHADEASAHAVVDESADADGRGEYTFVPEEELSLDELPDEATTLAAAASVSVSELKGATRYDTASAAVLSAFSTSTSVIVAGGDAVADAIAASGLAGALGCPILLCAQASIPDATASAIRSLGATEAIVLGGTSSVSQGVETGLKRLVGSVTRLSGTNRYDTQMAIFRQGASRGLWAADTAIVVTGESFADALSVSPVGYALKAPVFFCDATGALTSEAKNAIAGLSGVKNFIVASGTSWIPASTESYLSGLSKRRGGTTVRLSGATRYETSARIASYAVSNLGFTWDGVAFASGQSPYDSLAGGPVQGRSRSVMLLADATSSSSASSVDASKLATSIKFLGGTSTIPVDTRVSICNKLGVPSYRNVVSTAYDVTLDTMARLEEQVDAGYGNNSYSTFLSVLDPSSFTYATRDYLQFAKLNAGYSGVDASGLNAFVAANCSYSEGVYGRTSGLRNGGSWFVSAARTYGVNEVYLLAHAIWESAWGCSELASGWAPSSDGVVSVAGKQYPYKAGTRYYNFYGIGAYDANALSGGRAMAVKEGWTSPEKAVLGAAKWISANYHNRTEGRQNTLYLMKFDVPDAASSGSVWHQYCTGSNGWVLGISRLVSSCYASAGKAFSDLPLAFDVPVYRG